MGWPFSVILGATAVLVATIIRAGRWGGADGRGHAGRTARRDSTGRGGLAA